MKIEYAGGDKVLISLYSDIPSPKKIAKEIIVNSSKLTDWYPVYKSFEFRVNEDDTIKLYQNKLWDSKILFREDLKPHDIPLSFLSMGVIPDIKEQNERVLRSICRQYKLPNPNDVKNSKDFTFYIVKVLDMMDDRHTLISYIRANNSGHEKERVLMYDLERLGTIYYFYSLYRKVKA